jgi:glycosyltransferase involved in cell wall biosynthesis
MRPLGQLLDRIMMPLSVARADLVLAISQSTADQLVEYWSCMEGKVRVITPGVTKLPEPMQLGRWSAPIEAKRFFLFVGTLEPRKNLARLLSAHALGIRSNTYWPPLVIVGGDGWGAGSIGKLVARLGIRDKVLILGRVSDRELATLYANALVLLMPSLYEGFGFPLIESMALGTPAIASNVSSMPEVLGDAGILVDPLSVDSIFHGMAAFIKDGSLSGRLGSRARVQASQFSWDSAADQTLAALLSVATQGR